MHSLVPSRAVERCERLADLGPPPPWSRPWKLKRWLRAYRAIMALDITQHAEFLRSIYSTGYLQQMAERPSPALAFLSKPMPPRMTWVEAVTASSSKDDKDA